VEGVPARTHRHHSGAEAGGQPLAEIHHDDALTGHDVNALRGERCEQPLDRSAWHRHATESPNPPHSEAEPAVAQAYLHELRPDGQVHAVPVHASGNPQAVPDTRQPEAADPPRSLEPAREPKLEPRQREHEVEPVPTNQRRTLDGGHLCSISGKLRA